MLQIIKIVIQGGTVVPGHPGYLTDGYTIDAAGAQHLTRCLDKIDHHTLFLYIHLFYIHNIHSRLKIMFTVNNPLPIN